MDWWVSPETLCVPHNCKGNIFWGPLLSLEPLLPSLISGTSPAWHLVSSLALCGMTCPTSPVTWSFCPSQVNTAEPWPSRVSGCSGFSVRPSHPLCLCCCHSPAGHRVGTAWPLGPSPHAPALPRRWDRSCNSVWHPHSPAAAITSPCSVPGVDHGLWTHRRRRRRRATRYCGLVYNQLQCFPSTLPTLGI